jgi:glycosyltransferase involved in cell wall biosynthesis
VHVVPNPAPETSARRPRGGTASDTVIAVGRLVPQKGFDMLLDAWAQILGEHPGWRLRIVGEGASRPALEAQVRRLGIAASVDMPGFDPGPFQTMAASELYAFTSRYEGFAHVLVEAMACGLPVAAMDCPSGPRGIVRDGIDGFITPALDVAAFAGAMSRLMGDPALRDEMGANALQVGERFGAAAIWAQWDEILDETLASRRSAG